MQEIINVVQENVGGEVIQTVNARELHTYLGVGRDFSEWIKARIEKYDFVAEVDYTIAETLSTPRSGSTKARAQVLKEYHLAPTVAQMLTDHEQSRVRLKQDSIREGVALTTIEQVLGIKLIRQYYVDAYRVDGYDVVNKVAYEIDEKHHSKQEYDDAIRQKHIEALLGCTFVRVVV